MKNMFSQFSVITSFFKQQILRQLLECHLGLLRTKHKDIFVDTVVFSCITNSLLEKYSQKPL